MDNASPEKAARCCGLPKRIGLFVKNKCAVQVLCGCSPWLPWRTRSLCLRMWGALIAYFSPLPGFTKAQSFPIIRTADENANTLSTTREDTNYPNVKLDHEKSPFIDGFLGLMFFTWCKGYWFHLIQWEHISISFLTGLTASWYEMYLPPSSRSFHEYSWSGVCIMFLHYKKCMMQLSYRKHKQGYSLLLFFWGDDFHWRPLQDQHTFPAFNLPQTHSRLHLKGEQSELRLETRLRLSALS